MSVSISLSQFANLTAESGGAIYVSGGLSSDSQRWLIESSTFHHNSATLVGSIYLDSVFAVLRNNTFTGNSANVGGGLALLTKNESSQGAFEVLGNSFVENWAQEQGGAVFWQGAEPTFSANSFQRNGALYGADIASKAHRLKLAAGTDPELTNVPSGQPFPVAISLQLLDHYNSVVTSDSSSYALISSLDLSTSLAAVTRVQAHRGEYLFDNFVIVAPPSSNTSVSISSSALPANLSITLRVVMRACQVGETFDNNQCLLCGMGTYSLDPMLSCQNCPSEAMCYGNFTMVPRSGYWRPHHLTAKFLSCPNQEACLGSPHAPTVLNLTGECAEGYGGCMCQTCLEGYFRWAKVYCAPCSAMSSQIALQVGISVLLVVLLALVIYATLRAGGRGEHLEAVRIRMFVNYTQLIMLLGSLNLSWPSLVRQLFHAQESLGAFPESIFSLSCLLAGATEADVYYREMIIIALLLPVIVLLISLTWVISRFLHHTRSFLTNQLISAAVVIYVLSLPSVVRVMLSIFHCQEITAGEYWLDGPDVQCWTEQHSRYALGLALPSLVLWSLLVPAGLWVLLFRLRHTLDSIEGRVRFGFLTQGYRAEKYYWELVCVYRKLVVVLLTILSSGLSVAYQILACLALLCAASVLQQEQHPFVHSSLNKIEARGLLVTIVTLYCGMLYTAELTGDAAQVMIFLGILLMNVYFFVISLRKVVTSSLFALYSRLAFFFHSKGNLDASSPQYSNEVPDRRSDSIAPLAEAHTETKAAVI